MIWLCTLAFAQEPSPQEAIQKAFEREYAYVYAEKRSLQKQKENLFQQKTDSLSSVESSIVALEKELAFEKREYERLVSELEALEKASSEREEMQGAFSSMLIQAEQSLAQTATKATPQDRFQELFGALRSKIQEGRSLKRETGDIYLVDGKKVSGEMIRLGDVAAFGKVEEQSSALLSLGKNKFRLEPSIGDSVATALFAGETHVSGEIFISEGFSQEVSLSTEKTPLEVLQAGGFVAWVIAGLGVFGLLVALLRAFLLLLSPLRTLREEEELRRLHEGKASTVPLLSDLWNSKSASHDQLLEEAEAGLLGVESKTNRFATIIPVIAAVAPLLGLLGTVTGMIATFEIITEHGTGDPRMLSTGISEALITTQLGLMVAIPMLLLGNVLKSWSKQMLTTFESVVLRVVATRSDGSV